MKARLLMAGIALMGTIVASMAGGVPRLVHAGTITPIATVWQLTKSPWSGAVNGTGFTPGGAVHIDLGFALAAEQDVNVPTNEWRPFDVVASMDVRAARTTYVSNGHGIVFTKVGGYFTATIAPAPGTTLCSMGVEELYYYYVVATDLTTGQVTTMMPYGGECY